MWGAQPSRRLIGKCPIGVFQPGKEIVTNQERVIDSETSFFLKLASHLLRKKGPLGRIG